MKVLVTGGGGFLGQALCRGLVARGHDVTALHLDLASDESIEALHKTIIERAGRCDVLVNNAVTRSALDGWKHELDDFDASLRVKPGGRLIKKDERRFSNQAHGDIEFAPHTA